jgi:arylsulfatase A-like enzyme
MRDEGDRGVTNRRRRLAAGVLITATILALTPLASAPAGLSSAGSSALPAAKPRPNIVVIMTDDMRRDDLRWMSQTRRLIGRQGATFKHSFSPYPLCCPARASFLNGQYTHNHGVWSTRDPFGFQSFNDRQTLPVWLRAAGYNTLFLGKYLNGYGKQPTFNGGSSVRYVPPGWRDWRASIDGGLPPGHPLQGATYRYYDTTLSVNGRLQGHDGQYQTHVFGNQSVGMIRRYARSTKPFFLWTSYVAPHHGGPREADDPGRIQRVDGRRERIVTPAVTPAVRGRFDDRIRKPAGLPSEKDVSDKPEFLQRPPISRLERNGMLEAARQRAESLWLVDQQVARTVKALRAAGELRNTLIIFTSDNGYFQGEHRQRQGKTTPYEPALRTPLLMRGPGIPRGVSRRSPFLSIDFAPTILAAARVPRRGSMDGRSMLGAARNGGGWQRAVLTEVLYVPKSGNGDPDNWISSAGIRSPGLFYAEHSTGDVELYDMRRDPKQDRNVAGESAYAARRQRMARILDDMRTCDGAECREPLSSW